MTTSSVDLDLAKNGSGGSPSPLLSVDIERVICDMNRMFNPLHNDFVVLYLMGAYVNV